MFLNLMPSKASFGFRQGNLLLLENCYEFLKPYFQGKRQQEELLVEKAIPDTKPTEIERQIEENQILYSKLMTERLLRTKTF